MKRSSEAFSVCKKITLASIGNVNYRDPFELPIAYKVFSSLLSFYADNLVSSRWRSWDKKDTPSASSSLKYTIHLPYTHHDSLLFSFFSLFSSQQDIISPSHLCRTLAVRPMFTIACRVLLYLVLAQLGCEYNIL